MSGETQFYLVAIPAVILFNLAKGGFSGPRTIGGPILSLVASPVRAAAILKDGLGANAHICSEIQFERLRP